MNPFELIAPDSLDDVLSLLAEKDLETQIIAGGTGLINLVKQRLSHPARLVSLHRIETLSQIDHGDTALTVDALCRLADVERDDRVRTRFPVLAEALGEIASPRIRDMATIGGAVAHGDPAQDLPVVLMALDAEVILRSAHETLTIPLADFYVDYYETARKPEQLVTAVRIPLPSSNCRFAYKKFLPGSEEDYACVSVCVRLDFDDDDRCADARVILGAVGPTVFRARAAEALLAGATIDGEIAQAAAEAAREQTDPVDDTRGSADYKQRMAAIWTRRMILETGEA